MEKIVRSLILIILAFGTWLILSMDVSTVSVLFGFFFALMTAAFLLRFIYDPAEPGRGGIFLRIDLMIVYVFLLLIQSYISTYQLIKMMLSDDYQPGIIRIKTKVLSQLGKTALANTITLIPGTLALWLKGDHIYVHWFNQTTMNTIKAGRLITGGFEQLAKRIFG